MRKTMTKEVTFTTVRLAHMEMVDGLPVAKPLADEVVVGNVSMEKAQKEMNKKFETTVTVFEVLPETKVYQMSVEDFIKIADEVNEVKPVAEAE